MGGSGDPDDRARWLRLGVALLRGTAAYNGLEAVVALWAGVAARSIALVGFGLDSVIELSAALVVLRRVRLEAAGASPERVATAESGVRRFVGGTFLALAAYVTLQAAWILVTRAPPEESLPGIVLAVLSLLVMPLLALGKLRAAARIGSGALRAEAKETLACAYLSFTLLAGLGLNALLGWWWADPVAALLMVPWLVREGREQLEEAG